MKQQVTGCMWLPFTSLYSMHKNPNKSYLDYHTHWHMRCPLPCTRPLDWRRQWSGSPPQWSITPHEEAASLTSCHRLPSEPDDWSVCLWLQSFSDYESRGQGAVISPPRPVSTSRCGLGTRRPTRAGHKTARAKTATPSHTVKPCFKVLETRVPSWMYLWDFEVNSSY